jgi:hypothetical protein
MGCTYTGISPCLLKYCPKPFERCKYIKILGSYATGKLAATRTSPGTKSGINSSPIKNTSVIQSAMSGEIQRSMSGGIQSAMPSEIQRSMSGGIQRSMPGGI